MSHAQSTRGNVPYRRACNCGRICAVKISPMWWALALCLTLASRSGMTDKLFTAGCFLRFRHNIAFAIARQSMFADCLLVWFVLQRARLLREEKESLHAKPTHTTCDTHDTRATRHPRRSGQRELWPSWLCWPSETVMDMLIRAALDSSMSFTCLTDRSSVLIDEILAIFTRLVAFVSVFGLRLPLCRHNSSPFEDRNM